MNETTAKAAFELRKLESSDIESLTPIEWVVVQSEEPRPTKIEAVKEYLLGKKIIADQDAELAALRERVARLERVYQKHMAAAEKCNFVLCGCDWCEAYRAVLENK